jgi:hypothetical protein
MNLHSPVLALCALLVCSCATTAPKPPVARYTAPAAAAPVSPVAESVRADVAATGVVAARLEVQVEGLRKSADTLRTGMTTALAEVDRLRVAKTATATELDSLYTMLANSTVQVRDLFAEAESARETAASQRELRTKAETSLAALARAAAARDAEAASLRLQHADMAALVNDQAQANTALEIKLAKSEKNAALGSYVKGCIWVAAIGFLIFMALKIYKPF